MRRMTRQDLDRGAVLPIVLGLGIAMIILIAGGLTAARGGLFQAKTDQDSTGATDSAYAGVQEYLARLNVDPAYGQYGYASSFTSTSTFVPPPTTNPAFGWATGGGNAWASVPTGSSTPAACPSTAVPCFRYEVDNSQLASGGLLRIRSTGRMGNVTKTVVATVRRQGFVNYLYYTDYEVQDPLFSGKASCETYLWAGRDTGNCASIQFAASDTLGGPVHSNDTLTICGTTFLQGVTTANQKIPTYVTPTGCSNGRNGTGGPLVVQPVASIPLPKTNSSMRNQTDPDLAATTGCLYTGPTIVVYNGDGTMTVQSPWTKFTNVTAAGAKTNPAKCGSIAALHSALGATVPELGANLLYVQTVPSAQNLPSGAPDPNYAPSTAIPAGVTCIGADGTTSVSDAASSIGWRFGTYSFPLVGEAAADGWDAAPGIYNGSSAAAWNGSSNWSPTSVAYGCRNGDLYVKGTATTQTTAASDNYVYVIGDIKLADLSQDLLGLVATNAVLVWNPVKYDSTNGVQSMIGGTNREIDAAILSVKHTFQVQNYNVGPGRGVLTVRGSIAQKFRGPVATSNGSGGIASGYSKSYQYDPLLASVSPPYFLAPSTTTFVPLRYVGVPRAFSPDGTALP